MYTCFHKAAPSEYFWQVTMRGVGGQDKTPCQDCTALDTVGSLGPCLGCATHCRARTRNVQLSSHLLQCQVHFVADLLCLIHAIEIRLQTAMSTCHEQWFLPQECL